MKEENDLGYSALDTTEIIKLIKLMSKKKFNYHDYIKSEQDWWRLTNFVAQFYTNASPRQMWQKLAEKNEQTIEWIGDVCGDTALEKAISKTFFSNFESTYTWRSSWPQGKRQSFTYKYNRITAAMHRFYRSELRNPQNDYGYYGHACMRKDFNITSMFVAQHRNYGMIDNGYLGVADAKDLEEANMQFKMFVYPLIGIDTSNDGWEHIDVRWMCFVSQQQKFDAYIVLNSELVEKRLEHNTTHSKSLENLKQRIELNNLIIETARGNLLANMTQD